MDVVNLSRSRRFLRERPIRVNLFDRPRLVCDLICLESEQTEERAASAASDSLYLVVEGQARLRAGPQVEELQEMDVVLVPPGVEHTIENTGAGRLTIMASLTPKPTRASEFQPREERQPPRREPYRDRAPDEPRPAFNSDSRPAYNRDSRPSSNGGPRPAYNGGGSRPPYNGGSRPSYGGGPRPAYGGGQRPPYNGGSRPPYGGGPRAPREGFAPSERPSNRPSGPRPARQDGQQEEGPVWYPRPRTPWVQRGGPRPPARGPARGGPPRSSGGAPRGRAPFRPVSGDSERRDGSPPRREGSYGRPPAGADSERRDDRPPRREGSYGRPPTGGGPRNAGGSNFRPRGAGPNRPQAGRPAGAGERGEARGERPGGYAGKRSGPPNARRAPRPVTDARGGRSTRPGGTRNGRPAPNRSGPRTSEPRQSPS